MGIKVASHTAVEEALSAMIGDLTNLVIQYHPFSMHETPHHFLDFALYRNDLVFGVQHNGDVIANDKFIGNINDYTNTNGVLSIAVVSIPTGFVIGIGFRKYSVLQFWSRHGFQRHTFLGYAIQNLFYYNQALYFLSGDTIRRYHLQTHQVIVIHRDSNVKQFVSLPNKEMLVLTNDGKVYLKWAKGIQWIETPRPIHSLRFSHHMVFLNGNEFVYYVKNKSLKTYGFSDILQISKWHNLIMIRTIEELSFWCKNIYTKYDPIDQVVTTPLRYMWSISCGVSWCGKTKLVLATSDKLITLQ